MAVRSDCPAFEVAVELPHGLEEFCIGGVPQTAPVKIGAQLPDCGHELANSHLGYCLGQRLKGGEQFCSRDVLTHKRSLTRGELALLRR
jgi:hypothetical protein